MIKVFQSKSTKCIRIRACSYFSLLFLFVFICYFMIYKRFSQRMKLLWRLETNTILRGVVSIVLLIRNGGEWDLEYV